MRTTLQRGMCLALVSILAPQHCGNAGRVVAAVVDVSPSQAVHLPQIVAANPAGTTYRFRAGLYRLPQAGIPAKDGDVFEGATSCAPTTLSPPDSGVVGGGDAWRQPVAELRNMCEAKGAAPTVLSGAVELSNATFDPKRGFWTVPGLHGLDSGQHGNCNATHRACGFRNELFLGNRLLKRATNMSSITPMSWCIEYDTPNPAGKAYQLSTGTIYFSMPKDHSLSSTTPPTVELSTVRTAFTTFGEGWITVHNKSIPKGVSGVKIRNLVVEKIASYAQAAAIETSCSPADVVRGAASCGWVISGVEVRYSHGRGINNIQGATVSNCSTHHCGQLGFGGGSGLVSGCEIAYNNQAGFSTEWEAGGGKWVIHSGYLEISGNFVHDNFGDGLWADVSSINIGYLRNILLNNAGAGISHEISYYARMEGNWASGNGWGKQVWLWSAQLQVQNSRDVIVRNNTIFLSSKAATGICIVQQNRSCVECGLPLPYGQWPQPAVNNSVIDNAFFFDSCHGKVGEVADKFLMDLAQSANRFDSNSYYMFASASSSKPPATHWAWTIRNTSNSSQAINVDLSFVDFQKVARQEEHGTIHYGVGEC